MVVFIAVTNALIFIDLLLDAILNWHRNPHARNPIFQARRAERNILLMYCLQVFNLSLSKKEISKWNQRVLDVGWQDHLVPPLERLCSICRALDSWLQADPQHVAVLHSRCRPHCLVSVPVARWHAIDNRTE